MRKCVIVRILECVALFLENFTLIPFAIGTILVFYIISFKLQIQLAFYIAIALSAMISAIIVLVVWLFLWFILSAINNF